MSQARKKLKQIVDDVNVESAEWSLGPSSNHLPRPDSPPRNSIPDPSETLCTSDDGKTLVPSVSTCQDDFDGAFSTFHPPLPISKIKHSDEEPIANIHNSLASAHQAGSKSSPLIRPKKSSPIVTPVSSICSLTKSKSTKNIYVGLPSFNCLRTTQSESSFVQDVHRIDQIRNLRNPERRTANATFTFVQRSGKGPVLAALYQIQEMISQEKEIDKLSIPHLSETESNDTLEEEHSTRIDTVRQHLVGLYGYANDDYYRVIITAANAMTITVNAMSTFSNNELVQACGNLLLGKICCGTRQNGLKLVESGGLRQIIDSIKNFPSNPDICSLAIGCLYRVTGCTDLAVLFLENLRGAQEVIAAIPTSSLRFETLKNRDLLMERFSKKRTHLTSTTK